MYSFNRSSQEKRKDRMKLSLCIASIEALRKKERQDETQSTTKKLVARLVWVPIILFCEIFIPSYTFDALLCQNWPFLPPNQGGTLLINIICQ